MAKLNTFDDRSVRLIRDMVRSEMSRVKGSMLKEVLAALLRPNAYKFLRLFELTETLSAGGAAMAARVRWDEGGEDWVASEEDEDQFEVIAFIGSMSGEAGTRGIAANLFGKWVITQLDCE